MTSSRPVNNRPSPKPLLKAAQLSGTGGWDSKQSLRKANPLASHCEPAKNGRYGNLEGNFGENIGSILVFQ